MIQEKILFPNKKLKTIPEDLFWLNCLERGPDILFLFKASKIKNYLAQWFSRYGSQISSINITWELVLLNQNLWEWGPANCVLKYPPAEFWCPLKFETTDLDYELLDSLFLAPIFPTKPNTFQNAAGFGLTVNDKAEMTTEPF